MANQAQQRQAPWRRQQHSHNGHHRPNSFQPRQPTNPYTPRPYLGKCQACGTQGHSAQRCPFFKLVSQENQSQSVPSYQAYNAAMAAYDNQSWLLDSGASHHLTSNLANLSLHSPYTGNDCVQVGNGTGLPIANMGSGILPTPSRTLKHSQILYVPCISTNLLSVKKLCSDNKVSVEFFPNSFQVKELNSGMPVVQEKAHNGGYKWPTQLQSPTPPIFANSATTKASLLL